MHNLAIAFLSLWLATPWAAAEGAAQVDVEAWTTRVPDERGAQADSRSLSVEGRQVEPGHLVFKIEFRTPDFEAPGELRMDLWHGAEPPVVEANVSIRGGWTKWGLKAVVWIAGGACCGGSFGALCAACAVGGGTALDAIDDIDCDKECKPDCPIG